MGSNIKGMFFTDGVRSGVTILVLLLILASVAGSWAFPRQKTPTIDQETIDALRNVSVQLQKAAKTFEEQGKSTAALTSALTRQLNQAEANRNESYRLLMEKYGVEVPPSFQTPDNPAGSNVYPPNNTAEWLRPETGSKLGRNLPGSSGLAGGSSSVSTATADSARAVNNRGAIPAGYRTPDANEWVK